MNKYTAFNQEYIRYIILRFLSESPDWHANSDIIQMTLVDLGYEASFEDVNDALVWLASAELVTLELMAGDLTVATLTRAGGDAAAWRKIVPGLRRPLGGRIQGF
ncbi:hypothetical protein LJC36_00180 [Desulfovibrio sp. OttesenSCG-928-C14]|nr:hypothetical protein [Desulfovibrio sp. OttesenSCG-928-C14]